MVGGYPKTAVLCVEVRFDIFVIKELIDWLIGKTAHVTPAIRFVYR